MATKKSVPGTGSKTGRSPSKEVPVAPKSNHPDRFGMMPKRTGGGGMKGGGGKRGC